METVHFTLGNRLGITLAEISRDHLYAADLEKALNTFNDSFVGGCSVDLQYQLLTGEKIIIVNDQSFLVVDRDAQYDSLYPKIIDFKVFFKEKEEEINSYCKIFIKNIRKFAESFKDNTYKLSIPVKDIINFIYGNNNELINSVSENLYAEKRFIFILKNFIEKSLKFKTLSNQLKNKFNDIEFNVNELTILNNYVKALGKLDFEYFQTIKGEDNVESYIAAALENNKILKDNINPVNILDNYSAGWLAPDGTYYALNGDLANMLHNEIADALQKKKIIPKIDEDGNKINNPDSWLEQAGWVRIHKNSIQFAGCLNYKFNKPNVNMTEVQKKLIYEYCTICHSGVIRVGWRLTTISAIRFKETDNATLAKLYFEFN